MTIHITLELLMTHPELDEKAEFIPRRLAVAHVEEDVCLIVGD